MEEVSEPRNPDQAALEAEKERQKIEKKKALEKGLNRRSSAAELQQRNILFDQKLDPALQANAMKLRKEQIAKNLASSMSERPSDPNSIKYMEHQNIAPSVRGAAYDLNAQLQQRPAADSVSHLQQAYSTQAPSLQPAGYAVAQSISNRPTYDDLQARGLVGVGERKNQNAAALQQQLGRRQSRQEVQSMMPHSNVAPKLQGTAYELQQQMANRRDPNAKPEFVSRDVAPSMQPAAYDLNKKLGRRMSRDDLAARGMFTQRGYGYQAYQVEQKFANRPAQLPEKYAPMAGMAPSIQSSAHSISSKLARRPSRQEVQYFSQDANRQAPAIQGAAASVAKSLGRRPSRAELEASNILARMNMKSVQERGGDISAALKARPSMQELPNTIHQDFSHVRAEHESKERFRRNSNAVGEWLTQRPTQNQVPNSYYVDATQNKKRGSQEFKENEFESAWERQFTTDRPTPNQIPSRYFQEPSLKDRAEAYNLENSLRRRPTLDNIKAQGLIPNSHMAPSLRGVADLIKDKVGSVPDYDQMLKAGFTPEYLAGKSSATIQPAAKRVSNFLPNRMTQEELERRGILRGDRKENYDRNSAMIQPMFMKRKDRADVDQKILSGGLSQNISDSMRPAAFDLEKKLRNRRASQDLFNQNILKVDPNSDRLAMHKYYQEQKNRKQNLENALGRRMSIDDLQAKGIFQGKGIHDQFASQRKDLQMNMTKRQLKDALASRPREQEVPNKYFMEPKRKGRGKRRQSEDFRNSVLNMDQLLQNRPIPNAVPTSYFQEPNRQKEARQSIAGAFANRMTPAEMARLGLIAKDPTADDGYAPVDMRIFDNKQNDVKSQLEQQLRSRPDAKAMQEKGYVSNAQMAHGIAPAAHALEGKLRRRMSVDDLAARNILKNSGMAPRLQAQTEELEKRRLAEKLNGRMSRRPDREELVRAGLIDKRNMTPAQYEAKRQLEMNLRRHQMADMLASKKNENELNQKIFMEPSARRDRKMSVSMQNATAQMNQLFANRPQAYEVPNNYFVEPSRKRRMSVEMENIARKLDAKMMHRPRKEDIDENMWITSKDARGHGGRRVSHSMKQNQDILSQLLAGKKDMDQINEKVFKAPDARDQLRDKLSRRMSRDDLQARGILNAYHQNRSLAGKMTDLEKRLGRRPTLDHLQSQNIIHQGYGYQMDANMAAQKLLLDRQMKQQHLNQRLLNRPEKSELADRGYLDDSGLAPRLHPAALSLNQQLVEGSRMDRDELVRRGILPKATNNRRMSRSLMPAAHQLEKKLKRRMSIDDLANRNILDASGRGAGVVAAHKALDRGRRASRVEQMLQHRPDLEALQMKGIYSSEKVAPKLQGTAATIGKHLKRRPSQADVAPYMRYDPKVTSGRHTDALEDHLAARPLPSDLKRSGVLPGVPVEHQLDEYKWIDSRREYAELERKKHRQEMQQRQAQEEEWIEMRPTTYRRDSMSQRNDVKGMGKNRMRRMSNVLQSKLAMRPAMSDLADRGLLDDSGLAPRLHPTALQVQQNLTSRLDRDELVRRGILPDQGAAVSNQLSGRVQDLSKFMRERRPTLTQVADAGYVPQEYAQQFESKKEKRRRISVALEGRLRYRPTKESLADRGILDDSPLAPSLHAKAIDLQTRLIQQMGRDELQARGILTSDTNIARGLQGTRAELEQKMRRRMSRQDMNDLGYLDKTGTQLSTRLAGAARNISKGLRRRPSIDDLRSRNILSQFDQSMPPEMVEQAKAKNRANKAQRIKDMLASRPDREEIGAYGNFAVSDMANSLQGAGHAVSKMLKRRPSVDVLQQRNILQGNYQMGAAAGRAHELGMQQRRNTISQFIGAESKKRNQRAALENLGLPTNIATEDHIKRVLDMNTQMMLQMQQMQQQLNVLQMTCNSLVQERDQWKDQVKSLARQNTQELEMMKDYLRETLQQGAGPTSPSSLGVPKTDSAPRNSFRSELRDFKEQVVGMQQQAKQYLLNERERFQVKESAFKAHMLESDIQITRLQGEYEFTISAEKAGLKFEACDSGRNLCVKAVLKGSQPEQNGVMPGDVIITIRNPKENRVRRVENQDAQVTLDLFRQHPRPMICKFRKYEAHHQLRDLWRRKRELLENVPAGYNDYAQKNKPAEPGAKPKHTRRNSNLFHEQEISQNGITQEMLNRKREMEDALLQLKAAGHTDPIVRAFEEMDENQNGDLNEEEFCKGLYGIGIGEGLTTAQMKHVFKVLDDDNSGYIDYNEFEDFLKHGQTDPICEFVQRHIRDRIAALITQSKQDRIVRGGSMSAVDKAAAQKQQALSEREQMMRALQEAQQRQAAGSPTPKMRVQRSATADGDAPKAWREGFSEEDQYRIQQLTNEVGNILSNAMSWRAAVNSIRPTIPKLEYEIAKELYPLIKNRTIVERKDVIRRTLHIVDVIHAKVAPTKEQIAADKLASRQIDQLVEKARRQSTNDEAIRQMENLRYQQAKKEEDEQDDSSEEEYDYVGSSVAKADPTQSPQAKMESYDDVNKELQMENSGMSASQLAMFKQQMQAMEDQNQEESAFAEEDAENRANAAKQATVSKPTMTSKRRPSRQARQDALAGLAGPVDTVNPPPMDNVGAPPASEIKRRTSERIVSAIPKKARGSVDEGEGPVQLAGLENVEDQDDDKRAPETPRQDDKNADEPRSSTGGGEIVTPQARADS